MTEQERTDAIIMLSNISQQSYRAITTAVNPTRVKSAEATKHHTIVIQSRGRNE